ncbi:hypothetical protein I3842_12G063600 [Carya illinoinensis]|uniref:Uncharacterized protein n=1 Tax=Carya illinoinensis TaxID=32201 RepID=A0A922DHC7_CARIL|nr:hypothetical protein I3842_12G063600 [Carya illinoinensis]
MKIRNRVDGIVLHCLFYNFLHNCKTVSVERTKRNNSASPRHCREIVERKKPCREIAAFGFEELAMTHPDTEGGETRNKRC